MKKIMISLLMIAASLNIMAITYTGKVRVVLRATSNNAACAAIVATSDALNDGLNPSYYAELNDEGKEVLAYVEYEGTRYEHFGSSATTMRNMPFIMKANASGEYRMSFSEMEGTIEIYDVVAGANIDKTQPYIFTIEDTQKNNIIADRFIINYVPAPTCTTVRNNLVVNRYYTICLPKAVTAANGASFWSMSNRGEGVAYLEEVQLPLVAGRPYIFQAEDDELCVELSGDDAAAGAAGALVGTFTPMDQDALSTAASTAGSDLYLLYNNELRPAAGSGNNLPAYRAYIVYNQLILANPTPAPGRRVRAIPMQGQTATGVENLNASEAPAKAIIDGKLYIIRGEQMFDATGRLVK